MLFLNIHQVLRNFLIIGLLLFTSTTFAATALDLERRPASALAFLFMPSPKHSPLQSIATAMFFPQKNANGIKEINREADFNRTLHIRMQQTYQGYPVLGGDMVMHIPQAHRDHVQDSLTNLVTDKKAEVN